MESSIQTVAALPLFFTLAHYKKGTMEEVLCGIIAASTFFHIGDILESICSVCMDLKYHLYLEKTRSLNLQELFGGKHPRQC